MRKRKPDPKKSCEGKQRYAYKTDAEKAARALFRDRLAKTAAYYCHHCKGFHIGHRPGSGGKPRRIR